MGRDCSTPNTRFSFLLILEKKTLKNVYLVYLVFGVKFEKLDNNKYTWDSRLPEYQCWLKIKSVIYYNAIITCLSKMPS